MKRLVIAVDCDDVLVKTTPFFVGSYNKKYGTTATLASVRDPDPEIWQADDTMVLERWRKLMEEPEYKLLAPEPEEVCILRRLAEKHELHLITARKAEEREFTQELLSRELPGVFTSMEFVGWSGSKGEVCRSLEVDVLIDDNGHHLSDALACGLSAGSAILFGDYPWNEDYRQGKGIVFCKDWIAVEREVEKIAAS